MESWLFTTDCLDCVCCKNQSLLIASVVVLALKALPNSAKIMSWLSDKGINLGVTIISITILVPIATGQIGLKDLIQSFKTPMGWLGILCGILVAVLSSKGVGLINQSPEITVALVFGTILGVVFKRNCSWSDYCIGDDVRNHYYLSSLSTQKANKTRKRFVCFLVLINVHITI